jgi:predicted HD superfamily hydrolase involved in NAD metabolism
MDIEAIIQEVDRYIEKTLSPKRCSHSRSAAIFAENMSRRYGIDARKAYLAGLAHDMAKGLSVKDLEAMVRQANFDLEPIYFKDTGLLHGPAAEIMLREKFGVGDEEILEAVRLHTLGKRGMGRLAALVYCADKIEPERSHSSPELLERCVSDDLDLMLKSVLEDLLKYFRRKNLPVAPQTLSLYNSLGE